MRTILECSAMPVKTAVREHQSLIFKGTCPAAAFAGPRRPWPALICFALILKQQGKSEHQSAAI